MKRLIALGPVLGMLALGCFHHSARIELAPSPEAETELSRSEITRATGIVSRIATERGMVPDSPSSGNTHEGSDDHEPEHELLASYYRGPEAATGNNIGVFVHVEKRTGRYSVVVKDFDHPAGSEFARSLEKALEEELSEAFPSRKIRVERDTVGPALGP